MAVARTYADRCGVARALDLIGERWALLVVRELLFGPKRFSDLRTGLPHVSPNVLSERLRELQAAGILRARRLGPPVGARVYELTARGRELEPVLLALGSWGSRAPAPADAEMSVDSHMLALKTLFDARAAAGISACHLLEIEDDRFEARVSGDRLELARREPAHPDTTIRADRPILRALLWEGLDLDDAIGSGAVEVQGDRRAASRFLSLFPRTPAASE
jgi:DNA-binding HxlR family transcriptional regulator